MMTQEQIKAALNEIRQHRQTADNAAAAVTAGIASLPTHGMTGEYIAEKQKAVREKHVPSIISAISAVSDLNTQLRNSQAFYENTALLVSMEPVSKRLNGCPTAPAENPLHEAQTRHALLAEYALLPNTLLQAIADQAKASGDYGRLHLASIVNASRDEKDPTWKAIGLDGVDLPQQREALNSIKEGKAQQLFMEASWRASEGRKSDSSSMITAQRMLDEVSR